MENMYGEYEKEVKELLELIDSDKLLSGGHLPVGVNAKVIHSLDEIPTEDDYFEAGYYSWDNIISQESRKFYKIEMEKWPKDSPTSRLLPKIHNRLLARLTDYFPSEYEDYGIFDCVAGTLQVIAHCFIVMGKTHEFYYRLFEIYTSGGYPCGWEGNYPEGRLIVFYPNKTRDRHLLN